VKVADGEGEEPKEVIGELCRRATYRGEAVCSYTTCAGAGSDVLEEVPLCVHGWIVSAPILAPSDNLDPEVPQLAGVCGAKRQLPRHRVALLPDPR